MVFKISYSNCKEKPNKLLIKSLVRENNKRRHFKSKREAFIQNNKRPRNDSNPNASIQINLNNSNKKTLPPPLKTS